MCLCKVTSNRQILINQKIPSFSINMKTFLRLQKQWITKFRRKNLFIRRHAFRSKFFILKLKGYLVDIGFIINCQEKLPYHLSATKHTLFFVCTFGILAGHFEIIRKKMVTQQLHWQHYRIGASNSVQCGTVRMVKCTFRLTDVNPEASTYVHIRWHPYSDRSKSIEQIDNIIGNSWHFFDAFDRNLSEMASILSSSECKAVINGLNIMTEQTQWIFSNSNFR